MAQENLGISPAVLDLGYRPIGAWTEPGTFTLENTGVGDVTVNNAEITASDFFGVVGTFPQTLVEGDTYEVGISTFGTATPGVLNGNFVAQWGTGRAVTVASFTATAYEPPTGDVVESALDLAVVPAPFATAISGQNNGREFLGYYKNYILPNDLGSGPNEFDAVYKLEPATDVLISFTATIGSVNWAIYAEDFNGEAGPMATNALVQGLDDITNIELFAGTYYLVASALDNWDADYTVTAMPSPDAAVYVAPADGDVDIVNGDKLEWTFGANTLEYQVVLGTTYPPATIVVDWTSSQAEVSSPLDGTWMVANEPGCIGVGPAQGDIGWWSFQAGDLVQRACFMDDKYVFNADGSFQNVQDGSTFLEPWQGGAFNCGAPVAPHNGSANATYVYNENAGTLTLNGVGAYLGLPKAINGSELNNPNDAPASITYLVQLTDGGNTMFLDINVGGGWWRYKMVKSASVPGEYTLANLQPNLQYFWQVNTRNNNGTTVNPEIWGFTTTLSPPMDFMVDNDEIYEGDDVVLSWSSPIGGRAFLGYNVYQDGVQLNATLLTATTYTVSGLAYNMGGYDFTATTVYDEGESGPSAVATVQVSGEGMVNGNVSDFITSSDIAGASVVFTGNDEFGVEHTYTLTTNAAGDYSGDVLAGTYNVAVSASGYISQSLTGVAVAYGATVTNNYQLIETAFPVASVTASLFGDNILIEYTFDPETGNRALVEFQIWREKSYLPGSMEMIGTTSQYQFVDFDWDLQSWGVYKWYVVAVYDLNQSVPVASNPIDKDMNTMVDVTVALNSGESPAGTMVTFTNVDESPELVYTTTLGADGMFAWDSFRRGTYDIEVSLSGFTTITETSVDIFDASSFSWLLEETLATPASLYVTPTGLASWASSSPLEGTWLVANEPGCIGVGPVQGDIGWWSFQAGDIAQRACFMDDKYVFNADGSFQNVQDGSTFIEPWQGGSFNCGTPVAPHDGSAAATYEYNAGAGTLTLSGVGAYLGLPKAVNGSELGNPNDAPASITYLAQLSDDENTMIIDINVGGGWWRYKLVRQGTAMRSFEAYKIFFDGTLLGEVTGGEYQHGGFGETLVDGETYTTGVAAVFTTGQSATSEFTWKYVACDNYATPSAFAAEQVVGSLNINLSWTNVNGAALDTISAVRIYRNGLEYTQLDFAEGAVSSFLDEDLAFGDYSYCLTYIYDSGAETCADAVCSDVVTITGGGFVNGTVTAFDGGAPIAGATVTVSNANFSFQFTTNAAGQYAGEVVADTYNYLVEADAFTSQTLEGVAVVYGSTVTQNFALLEFPYAPSDVVATELSDNAVQIEWSANGGVPNGYSIYRTSCETGDLQFLGYTLDEQFTDNTWGGAGSGVYKWGVVAEYEFNNSETSFSNCLDKDMITQVSVTVSTNSLDSPAGTHVMFTNTSEPGLGLVYETDLNGSGYFMWDEFRKGTYDIAVNKAGFDPIEIMAYVIDGPEDFVWVLSEQFLPVSDLFVNPTGLATWAGVGGPASPVQGTWQVAAEIGSMGVGGSQGDISWWSVGEGDLTARVCFWDDEFIFGADGSFHNEFNETTFLEPWQGVNYECGAPVAPHDGSNPATYMFDEAAGTLTLNGVGAFLGLAKVYNGGELTNPNDAPESITYLVELIDDGNTMIVDINAAGNWWRYKLVKAGAASRELQGYKVWLDGVFVTDTPDNFWQYDVAGLVEGQEYFSEVAAVYTNGISPKMNYTWTYYSCENYPGPVNLVGDVDGQDVTLTWGGTAPPPPPAPIEILNETFESYTAGTQLAVQSQATNGWWTTWSNTPGSAEDPFVSSAEAFAGSNSVVIAQNNDAVLLLGDNYSSGNYHIDMEVYIPSGTTGYFNVLQSFAGATSQWGLEVYFNPGGTASINAGGTGTSSFAYTYDTWHHIYVNVNLDADAGTMKVNGNTVANWVWSAGATGTGTLNELHAMDFFGAAATDGAFYDNIHVTKDAEPAKGYAAIRPDHMNNIAVAANQASTTVNVADNTATSGTVVNHAGASKSIAANRALLYDNGPLVNSEGTGTGGADESILQNSTLGMTTLGAGIQFASGNHMADDFVVDATWNVDEFTFYGYQTNSGNTSTMTGGYLQIYDGNPSAGGTLIWGDMTTNRMTSTQFSNIYRISETTGGTARPVMEIVCETPGLTLEPGTYWVEYSFDGSGSSGPWAPPITITGQTTTGNALQSLAGVWQPFNDGGTLTPQGLPFLINGTVDNGGGGGTFDPGMIAGANVYRDGVLIAEMVQDTFYVDPGVDYGMHTYCVSYLYESGAESCSESCVDVMVLEDCTAPQNLVVENLSGGATGPQEIKLTWNENIATEYRYDDGTRLAQLGSSTGTINTVLGNKHDASAELTEMSWLLSDDATGGGPHATVQIYVMGLTSTGIPDGTNVLYTASVSNTDGQWNTHTFPSTIVADGGFFLGVGYNGFVGIGTDDGVGAPYEFQPNTHYFVGDYTVGGWETWETYNFSVNAMIRATGVEGAVASVATETIEPTTVQQTAAGQSLELRPASSAVHTGEPSWTSAISNRSNRDFLGFNIYKNGDLLEALWPETTYTYEESVVGNTCYTVTAEYEYCGESEPSNEACIDIVTGIDQLGVTAARLYPNPANNSITIEAADMSRLTVISAVGQVVYDATVNDQRVILNTASYEAGVYMVRIVTSNGMVTKRVTIVR